MDKQTEKPTPAPSKKELAPYERMFTKEMMEFAGITIGGGMMLFRGYQAINDRMFEGARSQNIRSLVARQMGEPQPEGSEPEAEVRVVEVQMGERMV